MYLITLVNTFRYIIFSVQFRFENFSDDFQIRICKHLINGFTRRVSSVLIVLSFFANSGQSDCLVLKLAVTFSFLEMTLIYIDCQSSCTMIHSRQMLCYTCMISFMAVGLDLFESVMETATLLLRLMACHNTFDSVKSYTKVFHLYIANFADCFGSISIRFCALRFCTSFFAV